MVGAIAINEDEELTSESSVIDTCQLIYEYRGIYGLQAREDE